MFLSCPSLACCTLQLTRLAVHPHENVVNLVARSYVGDGAVFLPMELCAGDALDVVGLLRNSNRYDDDDSSGLPALHSLFAQTVEAVVHCQRAGVYHGDIKPDNLLLTAACPPTVKLADWGVSTTLHDLDTVVRKRVMASTCGTLEYAAPEALACTLRNLEAASGAGSGDDAAAGGVGASGSNRRTSAMGRLARGIRRSLARALPVHRSPLASHARVHSIDNTVTPPPPPPLFEFDAEASMVWSLGVTVVVLAYGCYPWQRADASDVRYRSWQALWARGRVDGNASPTATTTTASTTTSTPIRGFSTPKASTPADAVGDGTPVCVLQPSRTPCTSLLSTVCSSTSRRLDACVADAVTPFADDEAGAPVGAIQHLYNLVSSTWTGHVIDGSGGVSQPPPASSALARLGACLRPAPASGTRRGASSLGVAEVVPQRHWSLLALVVRMLNPDPVGRIALSTVRHVLDEVVSRECWGGQVDL